MAIARLPFGRTGHASSRLIFGAVALADATPAESERTLALLLEHGINHIDTAASYGDSEDQLRPWLAEHRGAFFLATKTGDRDAATARESIHRSLERMGVDRLDAIQLHNLVHPGEWERALGPGGALEAAIEARDEGLVRFIGVTGHGLTVAHQHRQALDVFPFDSVLAPCNPVILRDPVYGPDFEALERTCAAREVALQTIKAVTRGPWGAAERTSPVWYEPLRDQHDIDRAVWFVLSRPTAFLNTIGDREVLAKVLDAAERFTAAPTDAEIDALVDDARLSPLFVS